MLVIFKSKAAGDMIMYERHAKMILDLLNRETKEGIIMADETAWAIGVLEAEIERRKAEEALEKEQREKEEREEEERQEKGERPDKDERRDARPKEVPVSFSARAYPFLEMLRAANRKKRDIVWGVP